MQWTVRKQQFPAISSGLTGGAGRNLVAATELRLGQVSFRHGLSNLDATGIPSPRVQREQGQKSPWKVAVIWRLYFRDFRSVRVLGRPKVVGHVFATAVRMAMTASRVGRGDRPFP